MEEKTQNGQGEGQQQKNGSKNHRPRHYYNKNKGHKQNQNSDKPIKTNGASFIGNDNKSQTEVKPDNQEKADKTINQNDGRINQNSRHNQKSENRNADNSQRNDGKKHKNNNNRNQKNKQNQPKNKESDTAEVKENTRENNNRDVQKQKKVEKPHTNAKQNNQDMPIDSTKTLLDTIPENDDIFGKSAFSFGTPKKQAPPKKVEEIVIPTIPDDVLFGVSHLVYTPKACDGPSTEIVGVKFKSAGKVYYFDPNGNKLSKGTNAIVDTARGLEFGEIYVANKMVSDDDIVQPLRKVIRPATEEDINHYKENRLREAEAFKICIEKIANHKLDMKLVDVQYAFDNSKLLFYFTSSGRVDFRELVRDLASVFKTRIELRQIGIRDEARLLGGIGMCGRPLCCSKYLSNFAQVSIKMAKEQGLSLNSNKISGNCGRLMCCLNFENQVYIDEIKNTPMPGSIVKVDGERGVVTDAHPLTGMLKVHLNNAEEGENITIHRDSVVIISKNNIESASENDNKNDDKEEDLS